MIKTGLSKAADAVAAIHELAGQLHGLDPSIVVLFFSSRYPAQDVARLAQTTWPHAHTVGCSTAGEIVSGQMADGSIVAMAIDRSVADAVSVAVIKDMSNPEEVKAACRALGDVLDGEYEQHIGIVLMDGMSGKEELVMDSLGNLTDLRFIGGSAGDDLAFQATTVVADGHDLTNAAVLTVLRVPAGYRIIKTQSFCRTGKTLTPTRVDAEKREVIEFNGQPASQAYMAAVGASNASEAATKFMSNPVGLMNGEDPYVRSPQAFDSEADIGHINQTATRPP